jgi:hypothetical protein
VYYCALLVILGFIVYKHLRTLAYRSQLPSYKGFLAILKTDPLKLLFKQFCLGAEGVAQ